MATIPKNAETSVEAEAQVTPKTYSRKFVLFASLSSAIVGAATGAGVTAVVMTKRTRALNNALAAS